MSPVLTDTGAEPGSRDPKVLLRQLPAVDEVARDSSARDMVVRWPRERVVSEIRQTLGDIRDSIIAGQFTRPVPDASSVLNQVRSRLESQDQSHHVRVVNGTGVILHTGLGRAVLAPRARMALADAMAGYSLVELDRHSGERNQRETVVAELLCALTGAEAATVVNNNAAATMIALAVLATGREVIVSRGQLVEIGGSFRIPDVMRQSGAVLQEVGCTNKVHLSDYEQAICDETALLMRVHTSNYRVVGFAEDVALSKLVELGRQRGIPVMDDLGSGCLVAVAGVGDEPLVAASIEAGADVVTFSGDKLLGGPQAGLIVGTRASVEAIRGHPLYRAMRPGKLTLVALEATLRLYRDSRTVRQEIPVLAQLEENLEVIEKRAAQLAGRLLQLAEGLEVEVLPGVSQVGGGALPTERLPTRVISLALAGLSAEQLGARLRQGEPPVLTRIHDQKVLIDVRTLLLGEEELVLLAVEGALAGGRAVKETG